MIFEDHKQWPVGPITIKTSKGEKTLTEAEQIETLLKKLRDKVGDKWPVNVKFHSSRVKLVDDPDQPSGKRLETPPSALITHEWSAIGLDGKSHIYTYCEYYNYDPIQKKNIYTPAFTELPGGYGTFYEKDQEFLIWMFLAFPNLEGGMNENSSPNIITFDLPHIERKKSVEFDTLYGEVLTLITNRKLGLGETALRKLLTSYFVPNVDAMDENDIMDFMKREAIKGNNQQEQIESMKKFLARNSNSETLKIAWLCQRAIEKGFIVWDYKRNTWNKVFDGKPVEPPICVVKPNEDRNQALRDIMFALDENKEYLNLYASELGWVDDEPEKVKTPTRKNKDTE